MPPPSLTTFSWISSDVFSPWPRNAALPVSGRTTGMVNGSAAVAAPSALIASAAARATAGKNLRRDLGILVIPGRRRYNRGRTRGFGTSEAHLNSAAVYPKKQD